MLNGYSDPMPKVIGKAMKLRKLSRPPKSAALPSIHTTPITSDRITAKEPRFDDVASNTTTTTARNETPVASGPSRSRERIISAKTVARLAVSTRVPSARRTPSIVFAIRSRLCPSFRAISGLYRM